MAMLPTPVAVAPAVLPSASRADKYLFEPELSASALSAAPTVL
ncbi:hypothetical protein PAMC26510_33325 [Caballeronia sordidicola]|uniref:Uncharacterized protein n=1 Tax=Caballeronia sordidicola TaxID=196367 RepID=A0A242M697_CABSO|nr:hypothetical protein PAMC26510_33325 [Caballeronia sordidicola]